MSPNASASATPLARFEDVFVRVIAGPAIALMAFAATYDRGLANLGLAVLLVGFFTVSPRYWRSLSRDPLVWLTALFFAWIPVSGMVLVERYPEYSEVIRTEGQVWLKVAFLPMLVTGFWLARVPRLMLWLPLILASGYLVRVIGMTDGDMLLRLFSEGRRAEFGMVATHFGMYSLLALIGAVTGTRAIGKIRETWVRRALFGYTITVALVATAGVVTAQTRSIWLASILLVVGIILVVVRGQDRAFIDRGRLWIILAGAGIVLASCTYAFGGIINARLADQGGTILKVLTLEFEGLDYNPIGYRIRSYAIGVQAWMDAPLLGHGPGIDRIRMLTANDPEMRWITHFHNEYLNILATYGVVGFILFGVLLTVVARNAARLPGAGADYRGVLAFFTAVGLVIAVFSVFGQSFTSHYMPFVVAIVGGIGVAARGRHVPGKALNGAELADWIGAASTQSGGSGARMSHRSVGFCSERKLPRLRGRMGRRSG